MIGEILGGEFKTLDNGDGVDATIANISLPYGFALSGRTVVVVECKRLAKIRELIGMNEDEESIEACGLIEGAMADEYDYLKHI